MRVAAIGRTAILYNSITAFESSPHDIDLIVTCEAEPFYTKNKDDFRALAEDLDIQFIETSDINQQKIIDRLDKFDIAISVNWKTIIESEVLDSLNHGILNYHAGDLPRYRGNAAMNWAIIEGEDEIVHTVHQMTEDLDAGPIFVQRSTAVTKDTYIGDVYQDARQMVPDMFIEAIDGIESGDLSPRHQSNNPNDALRCYPRKPIDSKINWEEPAEKIHRVIRASAEPLFGAFTFYNGNKLRVWRAKPERPPTPFLGTPGQVAERRPGNGTVAVITGDGFLILEEVEIQEEGRKPATDIITSNRDRLGIDIHNFIDE